MKKTFIYCLLSLLLLSFNTQANSITAGAEAAAVEGQAIKQVGKTAAKIMVARSLLKHKKLIIGGALVIGVGGFITREKFLDMIENPEKHEDFMLDLINDHPIKYIAFKKFLDLNIEKTDDMDYKQTLLDFEEFFHISKKDSISDKIENSPEYKNYLANILTKINDIESEYEMDKSKYQCDNAYYQKISYSLVDFPSILQLTKIGANNIYSVNRYGNFPESRPGYTPDHIPSYKAIHNFITLQGVILNPQRKYNEALDENLTAITIFTSEHQKGSRTYGGRNIKRSVSDAKNLKLATAKDIAFFSAYLTLFKFRNPTDYIKANETLIKRNFYLCLYQ